MALRVTMKWLFPALLVGGVVAACHDVAGPRTGDISLLISVSHAEASALAAVDQWRATVLGVTGKSATGAPGQTVTITGLAPGSYRVVCEGSEGGVVTYVDTASAAVQAGSNTPVTVVATAVVYDITITPEADTLVAIGDTTRLAAGVTRGGTAVPNATVRWSAGGVGVVTVNSVGLVTAVSNGIDTITASLGENSATAAVHVRQVAAGATSTITPEPASIPANGASTSVITVRLKDANGHDLTAGGDSVELATTAGTLSPPEDNGDGSYSATLTAPNLAGSATISGTVNGSQIVNDASVTFTTIVALVVVTPDGASLTGVGATQTFTAEARDSAGNVLPSAPVTWSSLNPNVATIDGSTGEATAVGNGQVTIAANAEGMVGYGLLTVAVPGMEPVNLWSVMESPTNAGLTSVWGISSSDVYAAGEGTILHYDGSMWSSMSIPWNEGLPSIWGTSSSDVYAAGWEILHYDGGIWSIVTADKSNAVAALWGTSPKDVYGVGEGGMILHCDISAWTAMSSPTVEALRDVWGFSSSDVYAVSNAGAVLSYNGGAWSVVSRPASQLSAIWGTSASDLYAVDAPGEMALHYDGNAWSTSNSAFPLNSISGSASGDVYAVGWGGGIVHYDSSAWSTVRSPSYPGRGLSDVWASPGSDVFAVGDSGTIVRGIRGASAVLTPASHTLTAVGDTTRFSAQARDATGNPVSGVSLTLWNSSDLSVATVDTEGLVTAVSSGVATITVTAPGGASGSAEIVVDQAAATIEVTPAGATIATAGGTQAFTGVAWDANGYLIPGKTFTWSTLNPNIAEIDPFAGVASPVGSGQVTIVAQADGAVGYGLLTVAVPGMDPVNLWSVMSSPTDSFLFAVWGTSSSDVYAVGMGGTILHYGGVSWSPMSNADGGNLHGVWGTSWSEVYAVGVSLLHYDGSAWSSMSSPPNLAIDAWGAAPSDVFAVGSSGLILHYDGTAWSTMASPTSEHLGRAWGSSTDDVYAVGSAGAVLHYGGSAWSVVSRPANNLSGIWGTAATDLYAVGDALYHYDGSTWSSMGTPAGAVAVWGTSSSDVYAVGGGGEILHYDGSTWRTVRSWTGVELANVWASPDSDVFAVGDSGTILRGIRGGSLLVTPDVATLTALGDTLRLSAEARDAGDNPVTGVTFTWRSSDEAVATVDTTGLVTAVANGVATITATASGGAADSAEITVDQPAPTTDVTPTRASATMSRARQSATPTIWSSNAISGNVLTWSRLYPGQQ